MRLWLACLAVALGPCSALAAPRDPSGVWLIEDRGARVRVEKCGAAGDRLCAFVVWVRPGGGGPTIDSNNPDPKKTKRPILGHQIMLGLKPNDEDQYEGLIYNAKDGKSYDVYVWNETPTVLKVKGCLVAFLCSTQTWTAVSDNAPGQLTGPTGEKDGPTADPEWAGKSSRPGPAQRGSRPKT